MNKPVFRFAVLLAWGISLFLTAFSQESRPNVLFISIDDLRPELGCYGVEGVHSPNIDRLAKKGVRFDRAYCQLAVCNPSRVSLLTGLRPDSTRVWRLDVRFRHTIPDAITLPQHFKDSGYHAVGFGKIFHNPWPDNVSWSEPHSWPKNSRLWSDRAREELSRFKDKLRGEGKPKPAIDRLRARATEIVDIPDAQHIDGAIANQALEAMRRLANQEKPFFLAAGFIRPHLPFVVPRKYWELYEREKIPLSEDGRLPEGAPEFAMNTMYELRDYFDYLGTPTPTEGSLTEAQQRELKHGYLASVSFIDAQVGLLLDEMEKLGVADETIVVLWSDHGWKLGEHNSWCKQTNYEIDARVPLIVYQPDAKGNGRASPSLVELVDLFPTLCDLAGISIPRGLEGTSLKPVLEEPDHSVKEAAFSQFPRRIGQRQLMGYSMRTDRWRYTEWIDRRTKEVVDRELYDHDVDPGERVNLAGNANSGETMGRLGKWLRKTITPVGLVAPPEKRVPRPTITFQNGGKKNLTVYWLPENGEPRRVGELKPGRSMTQNSTRGHRFRVKGGGINRVFTVAKQEQTHVLRVGNRKAPAGAPNILVIMGDDWSWPHASVLGDKTVKTPVFDRIAREGVLFENAFVSTPSCTPSRHAVASGQYPWRLGEGINLGSSLASDVPVYPDLLAEAGYVTGFCRKGTGPSRNTHRGNDPFGDRYRGFDAFMAEREEGQPFCFWYGAGEPHRPYDWESSRKKGMPLENIEVPPLSSGQQNGSNRSGRLLCQGGETGSACGRDARTSRGNRGIGRHGCCHDRGQWNAFSPRQGDTLRFRNPGSPGHSLGKEGEGREKGRAFHQPHRSRSDFSRGLRVARSGFYDGKFTYAGSAIRGGNRFGEEG